MENQQNPKPDKEASKTEGLLLNIDPNSEAAEVLRTIVTAGEFRRELSQKILYQYYAENPLPTFLF